MSINYASIKAAMIAAGYKATEGEGWAAADAAEFRTFSHFVLGIDHNDAHLVTTLPQVYQDKLEAAGIDALGTGVPEVVVEPSFADEEDEFATQAVFANANVAHEAAPAYETTAPESFAFTVSEPKAAAAPAVDASEPAATPANLVGEGVSTGEVVEPAQIADSATSQQDDETADDLEQAHHDAGDEADDADLDEDGGDDVGDVGDEATPPADDGDDTAEGDVDAAADDGEV